MGADGSGNITGRLIGINTAIYAPSGGNVGIGFAIPANMVEAIVDQLLSKGEVNRGYLGIQGMVQNSKRVHMASRDTF